jgi:hypothetical protein
VIVQTECLAQQAAVELVWHRVVVLPREILAFKVSRLWERLTLTPGDALHLRDESCLRPVP